MSKGRSEGLDRIAEEFEKYEDFLDSQITDTDMFYLEDETLARELVELGYRGTGEIITREDFNQKKKELAIQEEKRKMAKNYYNWESQSVYSNSTSNYIVIADNPSGLLFKNKKDRKLVVVDPWAPTAGDNTSRTSVYSAMYLQFVLYDHVTRRKT
uniref:Cilia- and flagella-associated protein 299 n=2 Tax=Mesocestoides corti TaxID=53468 RepID=A0A5K3FJH9_MESCO